MKSQLIDYVFIDELQLNKYSEQIPLKLNRERKHSWKISLSLTGPAVEAGQEVTSRTSSNHEKIQSLLKFLRKNELVADKRPVTYSEFEDGKPFVYESMVASKVIIPESTLKSINNLKGFSIWVAEPEIETLITLGYGFRTTYLYLTEAYWDSEKPSTGFSSYTAFQMLIDAMSGEFTGRWYSKPTKYGFVNQEHPLVKLVKLGGTKTDTRKITSLYRKRYMSNDAHMLVNGVSYRLNDLVGYPIFIANSV